MMKKIYKFLKNGFVLKIFFALLGAVLVILYCFMMYVSSSSTRVIQKEYVSYSELQTEHITSTLDDQFKSYSRVAALLAINREAKLFFFSKNSELLFPSMCTTISEQLKSYEEGFSAIDSIYLFPAYNGRVYMAQSMERSRNISQLEDENCLHLADTPDEITFVARKKDNRYPYLLTAYMPVYSKQDKAMIVLNIDVSGIPLLNQQDDDSYQQIYIVSEEGTLWYRKDQEDMPESLELVPELSHFDNTKDTYSTFVSGEDKTYIYVQQHSELYDWYYVTVTVPQNYMEKSYDFMSPLSTILPWMLGLAFLIIVWMTRMFSRPIHTIIEFLDNPIAGVPEDITEKESKRVIEQLVKYIQYNEEMSKELDKQLERKNNATYYALQAQINPHFLFNTLNLIRSMEIETLGFDHKAPEMTLILSKLLQYAFRSEELADLSTEFHYLELYAEILNYRYKGRVSVQMQIEEECRGVRVPKMILQPLVENAVYHGCVPGTDEQNEILVSARYKRGKCIISIQDDGMGMDAEQVEQLYKQMQETENISGNSVGIKNVAVRMRMIYGNSFKMEIESSQNDGTTVTLSIPFDK